MKRFINSLFILCIWTSLFADETVLPVPHSVSILPHTGQMQYTINMCHLQDPDFDWNVNLTYSSDGFRPLVYSGVVGQNWSLAIGGCITREVVGLPDDGKYKGDPYLDLGFLELLKSKQSDLENLHTDEQFYNYALAQGAYKDASSDIYSFSVPGHSGRFVIGWDGKARCLSGDVVKADFSSVSTQFVYNQNWNSILSGLKVPLPSQITLTTTDGYQYVFGGDSTTLEYAYTFSHTTGDAINSSPDPVITAWYLTRIIAPNKREMRFHYRQHAANQYCYTENGVGAFRPGTDSPRQFNALYTPFLTPYDDPDVSGEDIKGVWHIIAEQTISKSVFLDSVSTSDNSFSIRLNYENDSNYVFTHTQPFFGTTMPSGLQLKQKKPFVQAITVYSGNNTIVSWDLDYQEIRLSDRQTPRQYLSSCTTTGNIGYLFTYDFNGSGSLVELDTLAHMDMYGYRNTSNHYKIGTLIQVRDILGGLTSFEYEKTAFDSIRIFYEYGKSLLRPSSGITYNGIRTKQILVKDNAEHVYLRKCYQYGNSPGNGILNIDYAFLLSVPNDTCIYDVFGYLHTQPTGRTLLEYTEVEELVYKENVLLPFKNVYHYTPAQDSIGQSLHSAKEVKTVYGLVSQERRRGLPDRVDHYNTAGQLTKRTEYTYTPVATEHYSTNITELVCKIFHPQALLSHQTTTTIEINGSYTAQSSFAYDALSRVSREDSRIAGEHRFAEYTYIDALFVNDTLHQDKFAKGAWTMYKKNRINTPIETREGFVKNNTEYITSGIVDLPMRYEFTSPVEPPVPPIDSGIVIMGQKGASSIIDPPAPYTAPYATLKLQITAPLTDMEPLHLNSGNLVADSRYDTIVKYEYDDMMRPLRIMPKGEPVTYFYWDNKSLNILRKTTGANIIRFTWSPYVGMQSQTDVRGVTTYYRYNSLGQLIETYRMKGNTKEVLQYYEYHYPVIE